MKMPRDNEEIPPETKIRVVATIDRNVVEAMRRIHDRELQFARQQDRALPDWSNTVEMLLRKGVKSYEMK